MVLKTPTILVVVGITGDLATRKLLPAIGAIAKAGVLPTDFKIIGITRQPTITANSLSAGMGEFIKDHLEFFQMDQNDTSAYLRLSEQLLKIERNFGAPAQRLFYLAVPPGASRSIVEKLGTSGLAQMPLTKLLLEKPFGVDLESARDLVEHINRYFKPEQVYRIDHYLAKEMVQNLIVFREYNSLFRRTWNKDFIERIEILAAEEVGIEGRADFYEQTGALRDVVQSHLLQLAALMCMRFVGEGEMKEVPERRLQALKSLHIPPPNEKSLQAFSSRGQYQGYRAEVRNPRSTVETYVSLTLQSDDPRLIGIPITLTTGKKLGTKTTEIRIFYKKDHEGEANELVLRLQPNEGVTVSIWSKRPGYEKEVEMKTLDFTYAEHYTELPEAYERVLVDVIRSDHDLFVSSQEVLESWRIIAPLQEEWKKNTTDLYIYSAGGIPPRV